MQKPRCWALLADHDHARIVSRDYETHDYRIEAELSCAHAPTGGFVAWLARRIDEEAAHDRFDRLIVAASPKVLHALREAIGKSADRKLVHTLAKDLLKIPPHDLGAHLTPHFGPI